MVLRSRMSVRCERPWQVPSRTESVFASRLSGLGYFEKPITHQDSRAGQARPECGVKT